MSMQDPIADMLTRIRNAQLRLRARVRLPSSTLLVAIAKILQENGYIENYEVDSSSVHAMLDLSLKYYHGKAVISQIDRISKPGLRRYVSARDIPKVMGGYGIAILSTSKGLMTDNAARKLCVGGELICRVT